MANQDRAAMQMALEFLEYVDSRYMHLGSKGVDAVVALREALRNASERMAQPQGEPVAWYGLVMEAASELELASYAITQDSDSKRCALNAATWVREQAKKMRSTTPPVVSQGEPDCSSSGDSEPVAWMHPLDFGRECGTTPTQVSNEQVPLYTTPPSVEAAIEATKEKAAKVLDQMAEEAEADSEPSGYVRYYREKAAAIRSMK